MYEVVNCDNRTFFDTECMMRGKDCNYEIESIMSARNADHEHGQHSPCSVEVPPYTI